MHKNFFDIGKILLRNGADVTIKNMTEDRADGYLSPSIKGRSPTDEEGSVQKDVFFESMLKQLLHLRLEKLAEEQQKLQAQVFFPLSKSAS